MHCSILKPALGVAFAFTVTYAITPVPVPAPTIRVRCAFREPPRPAVPVQNIRFDSILSLPVPGPSEITAQCYIGLLHLRLVLEPVFKLVLIFI